ncbi:hypothetical protein FN846DRAFT_950295 [Sphaerosporella brunnea]|uniref:Uncharacterized protein n=1 Tax=Sphaerosporella brunnea TaxID=1250544 RepID=A0A5J5EWH3_9PEZI|nr:hypothetical protein FN846DRAFT_950295 [Sphaerosporella brunnea]
MAPIPIPQQHQIQMRSPTALDRLLSSRNAFFAFAGIIVGVSAWAIWRDEPLLGSPSPDDPFGDPSEWSEPELRRWLMAHDITPDEQETQEQLVQVVKACIIERTAAARQQNYGTV